MSSSYWRLAIPAKNITNLWKENLLITNQVYFHVVAKFMYQCVHRQR